MIRRACSSGPGARWCRSLRAHRAGAGLLGAGPDAIALLADASARGGLGVSRTTLGHAAGRATPFHRTSRGSAELFFVLAGRPQVLAGEEVVEVEAGGTLVVPPHAVPAFAAAPGSAADALIVITAGGGALTTPACCSASARAVPPRGSAGGQGRFDTHFVEQLPRRQTRAGPAPHPLRRHHAKDRRFHVHHRRRFHRQPPRVVGRATTAKAAMRPAFAWTTGCDSFSWAVSPTRAWPGRRRLGGGALLRPLNAMTSWLIPH